ncbi:DivIVA domain-containing protein, partial [Clavibacter michiganensis]|uniref:DivIVA domain-containing protein n=1 Tax=Clavibacter michiganensis TaxID=28447 RepID=UPI00117E3A06
MPHDDTPFSPAMRGYNRDEVDRAVADLRRELIRSNQQGAELRAEAERLRRSEQELRDELDEVGSPTFAGLGSRLEATLRVAEEQSTRLVAQADADAGRLRRATQEETDAQRAEAEATARHLVDSARAQAAQILDAARREADDLHERADDRAEGLRSDAERDGDDVLS